MPERDGISRSAYSDEVECRWWMNDTLRDRLANVRTAMENGQASFDPAIAASCVEAIAEEQCSPIDRVDLEFIDSVIWERLSACSTPFRGTLGLGEACFMPNECASGTSCRYGTDVPLTSEQTPAGIRSQPRIRFGLSGVRGFCARDRTEGERCGSTPQCAPGLYCRRTDFVCARPAGEGEACLAAIDESTGTVNAIIACAQRPRPLLCVAERCRRYPEAGEPCLPDVFGVVPCSPAPAANLTCVGRDFGGSGICTQRGAKGDLCGAGGGVPECTVSLGCNFVPQQEFGGTCGDPPAPGQSCDIDNRCAPPGVCYEPFKLCLVPAPARAGARCASDLDCASFRCAGGTQSRTGEKPGTCVNVAEVARCTGAGHSLAMGLSPPEFPPSGGGFAPPDGGAVDRPGPPPDVLPATR